MSQQFASTLAAARALGASGIPALLGIGAAIAADLGGSAASASDSQLFQSSRR